MISGNEEKYTLTHNAICMLKERYEEELNAERKD